MGFYLNLITEIIQIVLESKKIDIFLLSLIPNYKLLLQNTNSTQEIYIMFSPSIPMYLQIYKVSFLWIYTFVHLQWKKPVRLSL